MSTKTVFFFSLIFIIGQCVCAPLHAEFYKYTDKSGKTYYVDEIWKIPAEFRGGAGRYAEKYDHLPPEQRAKAVESEQDDRRALELEQEHQIDAHLQEAREREQAEKMRQSEIESERQRKAMETPVTIANNQILVPVTFGNSGLETTTQLIMDTGATHTVLYRPVADLLNILTLSKGMSKVAGGQSLYSEVGKVDSMRIGPITARDFTVVILSFDGTNPSHGGLLGMDFLRQVEYSIDYDSQLIRWKLRGR
jgi:predicted aspartyl protease